MSETCISRLAILFVALSLMASWSVRADAPNACKFLTTAAVSTALGKPVTGGGTTSVVDHVGATMSSCMYMAGQAMVLLAVDERGTANVAMQAYHSELEDSRSNDKTKKGASDEQKTTLEDGIGDGAFSNDMTNGSVTSMTAVNGSRLIKLGIIGAGPLPHERVRTLMQAALSH